MLLLIDLLTALLPLAYALAAANYAVYFVRRDPFAERTCTPFLMSTVGLHLLFFALRYLYFERFPLASLAEVLSCVALAIAAVYLYVERVQASRATGVFLVGVAALLQLFASAFLQHAVPAEPSPLFRSPWWTLHTLAVVVGYSAFFVGAVYAWMFVLLYRALRKKKFGLVFERLPSLDVLASMGMGATLLGLVAFTCVIVLGIVMSAGVVPGFYADPKFISAVVAWLVYAGAVGAHFFLGWRGARAVKLTLLGFVVAVFGVLGSTLLWRSFHVFHA
jgi:ABC-type uncharacterized transport system permease subunit